MNDEECEPCESRSRHGSSPPISTLPDQEQGTIELVSFEPSSKTEHPSKKPQGASEPSSRTEHSSMSHQYPFEPPSRETNLSSKGTDHLSQNHQNTLELSSKIIDYSSNTTDQQPDDPTTFLSYLRLNHELPKDDQDKYSILVHGPSCQEPRTLLTSITEDGGNSTKQPSHHSILSQICGFLF